jgi:hypothetical protein
MNKTAMMQLRDRLQVKESSCTNYDAIQVYKSLINLINTELLEIEKQQIVDAVEWNYKSNMGEVYYNATFNPK